ncbi:hypothetical protein LCGC14_0532360 [marine sediment metagenome]|uniref:Uncharacterized protein n=1 Tax=marine sediment metagenome TaxID=412755 RepID=A0A0F9SDN6_9ZZZZ
MDYLMKRLGEALGSCAVLGAAFGITFGLGVLVRHVA